MTGSSAVTCYEIRPAIVAPILLAVAAVLMALPDSVWWLLAIPFVFLGSICAQPNLNAADGCLAYVSAVAGMVLTVFHEPSGYSIVCGVVSSFYLSALEKFLRAERIESTDKTDIGRQQQVEQNGGEDPCPGS